MTAGCATQPQPLVEIRYEQVYVPDSILAGCPGVSWGGGDFAAVGALAEARRVALVNCDDRFRAARKYQDDLRREAAEKAKKPL